MCSGPTRPPTATARTAWTGTGRRSPRTRARGEAPSPAPPPGAASGLGGTDRSCHWASWAAEAQCDRCLSGGEVSNRRAQRRAMAGLRSLYPDLGPWTSAVLWHGVRRRAAVPSLGQLGREVDDIARQRLAPLLQRLCEEREVRLPAPIAQRLELNVLTWTLLSDAVLHVGSKVLDQLRAAGIAYT